MSFLSGKKTTCPNCGTQFDDPVVFCGSCGTRIPQKAAVPPPPPPPQPSPATTRMGQTAARYQAKQGARAPAPLPEPAPVAAAPAPAAVAPAPDKKPPESKRPSGKRKSTRPAAPGITDWGADPDHDQKLSDELDAGFYSIIQPKPETVDDEWGVASTRAGTSKAPHPKAPASPDPVDVAAAVELFEQLAPIYARPLRDFMLEVAWGDASKTWLAVCMPAAKSLRTASDRMDLGDLRAALDDFIAALEVIEGTDVAVIGPDAKDMLQGAYGKLIKVLPHVFELEKERGRREPMIVHALLQQVRGVGKVSLDKVFAAGLTGLEMLYAARPEELAITAGISLEVAHAICDRFQAYRTEVQKGRPEGARQADLKKLEALARELRSMNDAFKGAASGWSAQSAKDKRWLRSERDRVFLEIKVVLARSGEVELLEALERLPFDRKQARLETFLQESRTKGA